MSYITQVDSQASQISKMERFAKIAHVRQGPEWHMRLDRSSKCVLLWKPSISIFLPLTRDQRKTKTILHTDFEKFINNNSWHETQ